MTTSRQLVPYSFRCPHGTLIRPVRDAFGVWLLSRVALQRGRQSLAPSRRARPDGCIPAGPGARAAQLGALLAANDQRHPATLSDAQPRSARSNGTSSHVWHHQAILRTRLTVKQVNRELVLDFADPGGTTTGSSLPRSPGPGRPELATPARPPPQGGHPHLPSRPVPFPRWQASRCPL